MSAALYGNAVLSAARGCLDWKRTMPDSTTTEDQVIFSQNDLETWRANLAQAKEILLSAQKHHRFLEKRLEAAEFLSRKMRSDQIAAERCK